MIQHGYAFCTLEAAPSNTTRMPRSATPTSSLPSTCSVRTGGRKRMRSRSVVGGTGSARIYPASASALIAARVAGIPFWASSSRLAI